jgi:hypothetical protein
MPLILAGLLVMASGLAALFYALRRAPEGYESRDGFHRR